MRLKAFTTLTAVACAGAALAQDATDDWDMHQVPRDRTTMASIEFDSGIQVGVRCVGDNLEVLIAGLPNAPRGTQMRTIDYAFGDREMRSSSWWVGERGGRDVIFANFPAGMARQLRDGGDLNIRIPAANDEPARRHVVAIPPSPTAVDQVLTACDRPLEDRRDALRPDEASGTPQGMRWATPPRPDYPTSALSSGVSPGIAVISCLTREDGGVEECQVESEWPGNYGFGRAALRGTRSAKLEGTEGRPVRAGGVVVFTSTFQMR